MRFKIPNKNLPSQAIHVCLTTTLAFAAMSFFQATTSPIEKEILEEGILTAKTYPLFVSALYLGAIFTSLISGPISEWLGIKHTLVIFSPLAGLGAFLIILGFNGILIIAGRFLIGLFFGLITSIVPVFNAEVSTSSIRKIFGSLLGLSIRSGYILSYVLGIWIEFRWLAAIFLMFLVVVALNLFFPHESPQWLKSKGWINKSYKAKRYYGKKENSTSETKTTAASCLLTQSLPLDKELPLSFLSWTIIRPLLICISTHVLKTCSGYLLLNGFCAHLLKSVVNFDSKVASLFYMAFQLVGSIVFICIIQKVNWKRLIMLTTAIQMVANLILAITMFLSIRKYNCENNFDSLPQCTILEYAILLSIIVYGFISAVGWSSIAWWLYGEILHLKYRRISAGIATLSSFIAECLNQLIAPLLVEYLGPDIVFLGCTFVCLIALIMQWFY